MLNLMKRQIAKKYQSFERNRKQEGLTHSEQNNNNQTVGTCVDRL